MCDINKERFLLKETCANYKTKICIEFASWIKHHFLAGLMFNKKNSDKMNKDRMGVVLSHNKVAGIVNAMEQAAYDSKNEKTVVNFHSILPLLSQIYSNLRCR